MYDALVKIISSKRIVHNFLDLQHETGTVDHKIFFFPYFTGLDKLSEWRYFVFKREIVAISQTRFYQKSSCWCEGWCVEGVGKAGEEPVG